MAYGFPEEQTEPCSKIQVQYHISISNTLHCNASVIYLNAIIEEWMCSREIQSFCSRAVQCSTIFICNISQLQKVYWQKMRPLGKSNGFCITCVEWLFTIHCCQLDPYVLVSLTLDERLSLLANPGITSTNHRSTVYLYMFSIRLLYYDYVKLRREKTVIWANPRKSITYISGSYIKAANSPQHLTVILTHKTLLKKDWDFWQILKYHIT